MAQKAIIEQPAAQVKAKNRPHRREELEFFLFISPWLIGFFTLVIGPMILSFWMSFHNWDLLTPPEWIGLKNYQLLWADLFSDQNIRFAQSLKVTMIYAVVEVPLRLVLNLVVAILIDQKLRGMSLYRTLLYTPTVIPAIAASFMWLWILSPERGLATRLLEMLGLPDQNWLYDEHTALLTLIGMGLWGFGSGMIIFLAGLQSIPQHLYEAAELDGAGWWSKFWGVTVPMLSPVIFFNFIMGLVGNLQAFDGAFLITKGGPNYATHFYVLNLYNYGWRYFQMGLASAMAWVLFVIILVLTLIVVRSSPAWVYYEGEVRKG